MKENGCSQLKVVAHFRKEFPTFSQPTLSRWKKQESELREQAKNRNMLSYKKITQVEYPQVEKALAAWAIQAEAQKTQVRVTEEVLRIKARHFAVMCGIPLEQFIRCSNGWAHKFKIRYQLRSLRLHGEAASVTLEDVSAARKRLQDVSKDFRLEDIYNLDESGLYYRMPPDRSIASKQMSGSKKDKTRISLVFAVNADGSHSFPVISIGRAKCPRAFKKKSGKDLGFEYYWNKKAWMTGSIFQLCVVLVFLEYLQLLIPLFRVLEYINNEMRKRGRSILLYIDNAPSHIFDETKLTNIRVEFLEPNMTSHIQPLDAGVIRAFKAHYRRLYILRALLRDEAGLDDIYAIDQLEAMHLVDQAWSHISKETIANCWKHTGIICSSEPNNSPKTSAIIAPEVPPEVDKSVQELANAIERLATSGVVASRNVPAVEDLLNIEGEQITEALWTDEEIVEQACLEQQVEDGMEVQEVDCDEEVAPLLSNGAACQAITELIRLCEHRNEDIFHSARTLLSNLGMHLRAERTAAMRQPEITQFFATSNTS